MSSEKTKNQNLSRRKKGINKNEDNINQINESVTNESNVNDEKRTNHIWKRALKRSLLSFSILLIVYFSTKSNNKTEVVMASSEETISGSPKGQEVVCSKDYDNDRLQFKRCAPQRCGRFVTDEVVNDREAQQLLSLAKRGLSLGGSSGGASILDLHSGALSHQTSFANVYKIIETNKNKNIFTEKDFKVYKEVKNKILSTIAIHFGVSPQYLFLTHPTFFSRLTSEPSKTIHDEYWHKHIDKETYKSFHYTSLLYLSTHNQDFTGGRFVFVDNNSNRNVTIEPKFGRLSAFTSGSENEHFVEKVMSGTRYAITVSFTCDPKYAISDPSFIN
jgi:hypothetical protein